ncbi:riboflavin biosynthesis RibT protein [Ligilactobacillus sp. WC1T17]|uniref:Riboflavin biosynthesis RibT protein n=1 Tax=Ligilactobacillus ruminis TaxID=1623 RepID=A0ABY1ABL0_9LACO|nr:riboflavin biosynthesis RibT protein [Ligilactobacillus ruminis]
MLYKYKNDYEKIAMGLLSFIPDLKEISHLKACLAGYQTDDDRYLYLWKNDTGDFIGIVGIERDTDSHLLMVRHIAVTPAERGHGVTFLMLDALRQLYPDDEFMGSMDTAFLLARWEERENG